MTKKAEDEAKKATTEKQEKRLIGQYKFDEVELGVLDFWKKQDIYEKAVAKNKGKEKFFFIQGPPYTSGKFHSGHFWNNCLKDLTLRYKRMKGFDVFDRAAYDMHGLPTERQVMKEHKLDTKEDILKYGMENFNNDCMKYALEKAKIMDDDLRRFGVWLDFSDPAYPVNNSYIEGVWFLIQQAHKKGRLYEGLRTSTWCANCASGMAKHECEYKEVTDTSIFVKFPVRDKEKEYLIIWTTTPWTITFNLGVMVHPELDYVKAKVGDEIWYLAKGLAAPVIQNFTDYKLDIIEEFKGKDIEGLEYEHPWQNEIPQLKEIKAKHPKAFTILLSEEYVNLSAGTGLVHTAPGCGPEDFEVGHRNGIPPFNTLKENGVFPDDMGQFSGLKAKKDDKRFIEALKASGNLIATSEVEHDYAHCERCHEPVIFRATKQWFFKVEDLKERMIEGNNKVKWIPKTAYNAFNSWLENLRDNSITKQRFWGTPIPLWRCDSCGDYDVIGSAAELKSKAGHCPDNLHKPWIDEVQISCDCGGFKKRLPDVLDVWIDAGTLSWNILDYPKNKELYKRFWPADFILEAKEQVRGWYNMLMVTSILAFDDPHPFKACYCHGMLTDVEGVKMSKSLGNVISPYEVVSKYGSDTFRIYTGETAAWEDMNFSWDEINLRHRNLAVLWNMHKFLIDLFRNSDFRFKEDEKIKISLEEKYMLSKTNSALKNVSELMEEYKLDNTIPIITDLFLELSRTYIQLTREKSNGSEEERKAVFYTIYNSLMTTIKMLGLIAPFVTETIYQNLRQEFNLKTESVHLFDWPGFDAKLIDEQLEQEIDIAKAVMQAILAAREKAQLGVRWPVKEVVFETRKDNIATVAKFADLIKTQTNVKDIQAVERFDKVETTMKADFAKLGPAFGERSTKIIAQLACSNPQKVFETIDKEGTYDLKVDGETFELKREHILKIKEVPENYIDADCKAGCVYLDTTRNAELDAEGFAREIMRRVQSLRRDANLQKKDKIELCINVDAELNNMLVDWKKAIAEKCGAEKIEISEKECKGFNHSKQEKIKKHEINISLNAL